MPSAKATKEFQELYEKRFGKKIDAKEASEKSRRLLNLYRAFFEEKRGSRSVLETTKIDLGTPHVVRAHL